ncbi:MAG: LuxR C-terminal-related transcriptional regulator [Pseudonocardia sp.]
MGPENAALVAARTAYRERRWSAARDGFRAALADAPLTGPDLATMADCAWWLGLVDESIAAGEAAHRALMAEGDVRAAAWCAIDVAVNFLLRGDAEAGGRWIDRASRLLADLPECVEQGYLAYLLEVEGGLDSPDLEPVVAAARRVRDLGKRFGHATLVAASLLGEGRARVRQERVAEGLVLLDEALAALLSDDVAPDWAGDIYCNLMATFYELGDLARTRRMVALTEEWLATVPPAVLFTGICRVHRAQLLRLAGAWQDAEREAAQVCAELEGIAVLAVGEGRYELGELHRLRGDLDAAEGEFLRAHRLGREPQPGFALLTLAQERPESAAASVRAALLAETTDRLAQARLLGPATEILLACEDVTDAADAAAELAEIAESFTSPGFAAAADQAQGAVALARDRAAQAQPLLRSALRRWQQLGAPYDAARSRVLLACAYRDLGHPDDAERELAVAADDFERLGASADAAAVAALRGRPMLPGGLTRREAEVLGHVAAGRTNREIAAALSVKEQTVARHLSTICGKLGVTSRTAAAEVARRFGLTAPE